VATLLACVVNIGIMNGVYICRFFLSGGRMTGIERAFSLYCYLAFEDME
jgi:hypothetical protein